MALALLLFGVVADAADLKPFGSGTQIGARIVGISFPDNLSKELTSGLTNRILIRLVLSADGQPIGQRSVELAIRYDLWDENFRATLSVDGAVAEARTYPSLAALRTFLANLVIRGLFSRTELPAAGLLTLRADMLLNPIDREKLDQIRKWVAENSTYTPSGPEGLGQAATASTSAIIFNKIFEQYAAGSDLAASWQATVSSSSFRLDSVPAEAQN